MGSKYVPSIKDVQANLRYQRKQQEAARAKRSAAKAAPPKPNAP